MVQAEKEEEDLRALVGRFTAVIRSGGPLVLVAGGF